MLLRNIRHKRHAAKLSRPTLCTKYFIIVLYLMGIWMRTIIVHSMPWIIVPDVVIVHQNTFKLLLDLLSLTWIVISCLTSNSYIRIVCVNRWFIFSRWVPYSWPIELQTLWMQLRSLTRVKPLIWSLSIADCVGLLCAIWIIAESSRRILPLDKSSTFSFFTTSAPTSVFM